MAASDKFPPVGRDSIQWNELLAPNRNQDDNQQLWLTKRSAQVRNLFAKMTYFMCGGSCHV